VFGFIFNLFFYGFHLTDILLLVPLPIYFFSSILTTGRTDLIFLFCVVIFSIFFCAQKRFNYSFLVNLLLVLFSVIAGVSFVAFFFFANFNKYGGIGDFSLELFRYSGSAINALDIFLNSAQPRTSIFGQHTLYSIFSLLFRLGFGVPALPNAALPATMIFKISTNIYTVYLRWIIDYGFFASFLISFFWGLIYSYFFCSFESKQRIGYSAVVLAYLMYPVVFSSIEDGFIATYSFSLLYNGVYMYAAWILFTQRNNICKFYFASRGKTMKNVL
jgi:oligosaccharide repeat unit polymerase